MEADGLSVLLFVSSSVERVLTFLDGDRLCENRGPFGKTSRRETSVGEQGTRAPIFPLFLLQIPQWYRVNLCRSYTYCDQV